MTPRFVGREPTSPGWMGRDLSTRARGRCPSTVDVESDDPLLPSTLPGEDVYSSGPKIPDSSTVSVRLYLPWDSPVWDLQKHDSGRRDTGRGTVVLLGRPGSVSSEPGTRNVPTGVTGRVSDFRD